MSETISRESRRRSEDSSDVSNRTKSTKYQFSSTCSTYLTSLGYSIGMSDIWRFPFLAYRNGGGAFLIPFFTMMIICGIPMYFLEYSIGKFSGKGPYKVWDISPLFRGIGITISVAYAIFLIGTSVFRCYLIEFFINTFRDPLPWSHCNNTWNTASCRSDQGIIKSNYFNMSGPQNANSTFSISTEIKPGIVETTTGTNISETGMSPAEEYWQYKVLQLSPGVYDLYPVIWSYFLYMAVVRLLTFLGTVKSVRSIEKVMYISGTVPLILTTAIFIRSSMLPGFSDGVKYFFYPDFEMIVRVRVWIEATLMAFYTLGFGWGVTTLIGSHADFRDNSIRAAVLLPIIDAFVAAFSGMVCFCVLGNMAHAHGIHIKEVISAGMATGVVAYITALSSLPVPQLWTALFLISAFLTGVDGQLLPIDLIMQFIGDCFPRLHAHSRVVSLTIVSLVFYVLSLVTCTGAGTYIFLWVDWYTGAWVGPIVAFIEIMVVAWIYGLDRFDEDIELMVGRSTPAILRITLAFISPLIVAIIFCVSIVEYVPPTYGAYTYPTSARILGWVLVFVLALPILLRAGYVIRRSHGSIIDRLKRQLMPSENWGPSEEKYRSAYNEKVFKLRMYKDRTLSDLFYYNLFGSYPKSATFNVIGNDVNEMKSLRSY